MKNNKVLMLVYCSLFTALVVIATAVLQISYGKGYVNLGDGVIFASAAVLGPLAAVVGGVGSALADWLAGYSVYIPATLVIKAIMGLLAAKLIADAGKPSAKNIFVYALAEVVMVGGYFVYETVLYGMPTATVSLLPNAIQGVFGIVIGTILAPITRRIFAPKA